MTFPRSAPGFGGLNPPRCTELRRGRGDWGWHGEGHPPTPPQASAAAGLGVSGGAQWGTPTFLPPAKALLRFKAGCKGNERGAGAGEGVLGGEHSFAPSPSPKSLCKAPLSSPGQPPTGILGGGGGHRQREQQPPCKKGENCPKTTPEPSWGVPALGHWLSPGWYWGSVAVK